MAEKMTFFESYYSAIMKIKDPADRLKAFEVVCGYGITGKAGEDLDGVAAIVFDLVKPNIDASEKKRTAGEKGGRPSNENCAFEESESTLSKSENQNESVLLQNEKPKHDCAFAKPKSDKEKDKEVDKDMDKGSSKRTPTQEAQIEESPLSDPVKKKLMEWLAYKREQRQPYKPTGFKSLLSEVYRHEQESGPDAVVTLINECMSNGWKGIIWDRLDKPPTVRPSPKPAKNAKVHSFDERPHDFAELEQQLIKNI